MAEVPRYDAAVIGKHAKRLYSKATWAIAKMTVIGIIIGASAGVAIVAAAKPKDSPGIALLVATILGAAGGAVIGVERAFRYRLEAQQALCLAQIERNTRSPHDDQRDVEGREAQARTDQRLPIGADTRDHARERQSD